MKLIIDIPEEIYKHMMGNDLLQSVHGNMCYKAVCNGIPIPDNTTNQEKYIEIFGIDAWKQMIVFSGLADQFKEFWTSPYQKGGNE